MTTTNAPRNAAALDTAVHTVIAELGEATPIADLLDAVFMVTGTWTLTDEQYVETRIRAIRGW